MKKVITLICILSLSLYSLVIDGKECANVTNNKSDTRGEMITESMKKNFKLPNEAFGKSLIISRTKETCSNGTTRITEEINFENKIYTYSHSS